MAKSKPYNEKNDKPQDKKDTKGLTPSEKKKFEKMDKKHKKVKTMSKDRAEDLKIKEKILAKRKKKK